MVYAVAYWTAKTCSVPSTVSDAIKKASKPSIEKLNSKAISPKLHPRMSEVKAKKKSIPKVVKDLCWTKYIGDNVAKTKCMCCETNDIKMNDFQCGHVIAESNNGKITVDNLRPICKACNLSMGTENLYDFKKRCGFEKVLAPEPEVKKDDAIIYWSPGMFSSGAPIKLPKYIHWKKGTDSIKMGQELQQYGYVYNGGIYELK